MAPKKKKKAIADTPEQVEARANLLIPCQSKEHLALWFKHYLSVDFFDQTVSRFSTSNPLDAAWRIYEHAMFFQGYDPLKIMFIASRSSQKTLLMAALETVMMIHARRNVLHYACIEIQADVAWGYVQGFFAKPYLRDLVIGKPTADDLKLRIPFIEDPSREPLEVIAKVLSITEATVQGQHAPFLAIDELLTLKHGKRKAFEDLNGVPDSDHISGKPYIRAEISSRKGAFSLVEERLATANETGLVVEKWNVLDVTKACPDSRSGVIPTTYYGSPSLGVTLSPANYEKLTESEKTKFYKTEGFENCVGCEISSFCLSDLKKQKSTSKALKPIEKLISDYKSNSIEWWLSQALSLMPSSEGLVYSKFNKEKHVKTINEVWRQLTGENSQFPISMSKLVEQLKKLNYKTYAGLDHTGGTGFAAIVIGAVSPDEKISYVLESFAETKLDLEDLMTHLARLRNKYGFQLIYADPAWADKNKLLSKKGFGIRSSFKRDVETGIEIVRTKLMSASGEVSMFFVDETTKPIQNEFMKYHYKENSDGSFSDEPEEAFNDNFDSLRYLCINVFGKHGKVLAPEYSNQEKDLFKKEKMANGMFMDEWLQTKMNEAAAQHRAELGIDEGPEETGANHDGSLKWIF